LDLNRDSLELNNNNQFNINDINELNKEFYDQEFFNTNEITDIDS
jgi:hypothetical protein